MESIDPVFTGNRMFTEELKKHWVYHPNFDYEVFSTEKDIIHGFDLLYIDVAPHDYEQTVTMLSERFITRLKKGGYLLLDDCSPLHQEEVIETPKGLWNVGAMYGTLRATLEFLDERDEDIEFAFSVENNHSNGLLLIKFKE